MAFPIINLPQFGSRTQGRKPGSRGSMEYRYGVDDNPSRYDEEMGIEQSTDIGFPDQPPPRTGAMDLPIIDLPPQRMAGMIPEVEPPIRSAPQPGVISAPEWHPPMAPSTAPDWHPPMIAPPPPAQPPEIERVSEPGMVGGPPSTSPVQPTGRAAMTPQPPVRTPGKGWKGRLASIGKAALYGAGMGAQSGGAGAIGGALAGAITGGVSPGAVARYEHKNIDMPEWERTHAREEEEFRRGQAEENVIRDDRRADAAQDLARRGQDLGEAYRRDQLKATVADRQEREQQRLSEKAEARAAAAIARSQSTGQPVDPIEVKGTSQERWSGKVVPRSERPLSRYEEESLKLRGRADARAEAEAVRKGEGGGLTPAQENQRVQGAQRAIDKFHGLQNKLKAVDARWRNAQRDAQNPDPKAGPAQKAKAVAAMNKLQAEYDKLKDDVNSARESLKAHGDTVKINSDGTFAEVQKPQRAATGRASAKDPRVGKVFTHSDGKKYRITGIDSDGDPIGEPIQ